MSPLAALLAAAALAAASPARAEVSLTDDLGRRVTLAAPASRIVTLAPSITEAAFAVGAGGRVVGVSAWSDHPPQAALLPVVSSAFTIDMEALGARVFVVRSRTLSEIPRLLAVTAALSGGDAGPASREFDARLAKARARYAGRPPVRVFLEISHRPLMTVAGAHFMNEALAACGAANVFSDLAEVAPQVSWEELYARNPQAIVGTGPEGGEEAFLRDWAERASLEAVRRGKVAYVASRALGRPSPRVVEGIEALCAAVDRLR